MLCNNSFPNVCILVMIFYNSVCLILLILPCLSLKRDIFYQNCLCFSVPYISSLLLLLKPCLYIDFNVLLNYDGCFFAFVAWITLKLQNYTCHCAIFLEILLPQPEPVHPGSNTVLLYVQSENNFCVWEDIWIFQHTK